MELNEMAQWVKGFAAKTNWPEFSPQYPHGCRKESIPYKLSSDFIHAPRFACPYAHIIHTHPHK